MRHPAASTALAATLALAAGCASSTGTGGSPVGSPVPASGATSSPAAPSTAAVSPVPTIGRGPIQIAPTATCVQGWTTVTPGTTDYATAVLLLPQLAGAEAVRVFTGPLPAGGTGMHVYARTESDRLLAVQAADGPGVVVAAALGTKGWHAGDWHWRSAPAQRAGLTGADPVTAGLLPATQAGCLDGT